MPIRKSHYAVIDFETTSVNPLECYPIELAGKIYNSRSLEPIDGAEFCSLCRPPKDHPVDYIKTKEITGITKEEIEGASPIEIVYQKFVDWLLKYNQENNKWTALIPCTQNGTFFDLIIHQRMMHLYAKNIPTEKVFRNRGIDLMDITQLWFENTNDLESYGLTALRKFFGIPLDKQHRGLIDCEHTGWIAMKMLKFHRQLATTYLPDMQNAYSKQKKLEI